MKRCLKAGGKHTERERQKKSNLERKVVGKVKNEVPNLTCRYHSCWQIFIKKKKITIFLCEKVSNQLIVNKYQVLFLVKSTNDQKADRIGDRTASSDPEQKAI